MENAEVHTHKIETEEKFGEVRIADVTVRKNVWMRFLNIKFRKVMLSLSVMKDQKEAECRKCFIHLRQSAVIKN